MLNPRRRDNRRKRLAKRLERRGHRPERLEARQLLAADPIHLGVVYLETDYLESDSDVGSDSRGDRFIVSFTGGAPDTQLHELRIRTDKDGDGITVGDPIYDTEVGGRGKNGAHGFELIRATSVTGESIEAVAEVEDGGQELILRLSNFHAGDRLEFTIDVDEVLRNSADLDVFNDRLDVITSGQEFQDSILEATFHAPKFEAAQADSIFLNDFGDPATVYGIDVPADEGPDIDSRPNRSAAAVVTTQQTPKPIEISGNVWIDNDLDAVRQSSERPLADVELSLWQLDEDGTYIDTGHRSVTDSSGRYAFPKSLGLLPGTYRLTQTQPVDYISVAAVPGTVESGTTDTGIAVTPNEITQIEIPFGDSVATDYDFAEAERSSLSGHVYVDSNQNGRRDPGEPTLPDVPIELIPIDTLAPQSRQQTTTNADGTYAFDGLSPGTYEVIQVEQPADYLDGVDRPGTIDGQPVGMADEPGDRIAEIQIQGGDRAVDYDFGEIPFGQINGYVYLAAPGSDCHVDHEDNLPLSDVRLELIDANGQTIATTTTNADGRYRFDEVRPGNYRIRQQTPEALLDGSSHPRQISDVTVGVGVDGSTIADIGIGGGDIAANYNFCEISPASLGGVVFHDRNENGIQDPDEERIENVSIKLTDEAGNVLRETVSDANGEYEFQRLRPGQYTIVQMQPDGWIDGREQLGRVDGQSQGTVENDRFLQIDLRQGQQGFAYNFGEILPGSISGRVHADLDQDCEADDDETRLSDVVVRLLDASGTEIAQTRTANDGTYSFANLTPGVYTLVQEQPDDYFDGSAKAGSAGGVSGVNRIEQIRLGSAQHIVAYDFCEIPPASIEGTVWQESNSNRQLDADDQPIAGVRIELLNENGDVVRSVRTNSAGRYRFSNLQPGIYAIRETQPQDLFHGAQLVGTSGGAVRAQDWIANVSLRPGVEAIGYDFVEIPPSSISGYVFQDGEPLVLDDAPDPRQIRQYRDGVRTPDDLGLAGVTLQLRDAAGRPVQSTAALGGVYEAGPIRAVTDSNGYFEFVGLPAGTFHLYQVQPDDFVDSLDTAGTAGGVPINAADPLTAEDAALLENLQSSAETDPGSDAILNIVLRAGERSENNHFSEIVVVDPPPPPPPPPAPEVPEPPPEPDPLNVPPPPNAELVRALPDPLQPARLPLTALDKIRSVGSRDATAPPAIMPIIDEWAVSWHLSVINGGYPRGVLNYVSVTRPVSTIYRASAWQSTEHNAGRWTSVNDEGANIIADISLGNLDGVALAGDFDGDGSDEPVIFVGGQWFVDINGNGVWDSDDLWIQLGTELDRPVVGDWDGDGKDDVGIFGRQWQYDPIRIPRDPGLPDPANTRRRKMEQTAATRTAAEQAAERNTDPPRLLRRKQQGQLRADIVDHVFHYGEQADKPVVGDWNGDGIDQVAVFNAGRWLLDEDGDGRRSDEDSPVSFGAPGDTPIAGDFDGDGIDEIGVVRGQWWIIDTDGDRKLTGNDMQIEVVRDQPDSQPVVADWDGDGKDEPGYYSAQ